MNDELKEARTYSEKQELFVAKYMNGSKFGEKCPRKNVWLVAEATNLVPAYMNVTTRLAAKSNINSHLLRDFFFFFFYLRCCIIEFSLTL